MNLSNKQVKHLEKIIASVQGLLEEAKKVPASSGRENGAQAGNKRIRRSGKELVAFRKMLKAERKKGTPVADIAREHNVSQAYIYQL